MVIDLGLIDFESAYALQREYVRLRKLNKIGDSIVLAEHKSVFTIGRTGSFDNLLVSGLELLEKGIRVLRVDRGGDITYHGPGQLILYPIFDLKAHGRDLHAYMRRLEEVGIEILKEYGIAGRIIDGKTGVWIGAKKIASIGIAASNWVTYHGLSINANCDLNFFSMVNACGIKGVETTSLQKMLGRTVPMDELKATAVAKFKGIFNLKGGPIEKREFAFLA